MVGARPLLLPLDMSERTKRLWTAISRAAVMAIGVTAMGAGTMGCGLKMPWGDYDDGSDGALGRHSEAVVVDYYRGKTKLRSCAGTLLSSNVVIAPAHCADGSTKAVVGALDTKRTRTSVARVYTYDWVQGDKTMNRSQRHDVALLVTRKPIEKVRFAKVQGKTCASCNVVSIGRARDKGSRVLSISKKLKYAGKSSSGNATRIGMRTSRVSSRGGAVYRQTSADERLIVGLVIGRTKKTGSTVVVPLTNPVMHTWIRAVVTTEGKIAAMHKSAPSAKKVKTTSLRFLADDEETPTESAPAEESSSSSSSGGESEQPSEPASEPAEEKVDDESTSQNQPSADPAPEADREQPSESTDSPSEPEKDPVTETPSENDPGNTSEPSSEPQEDKPSSETEDKPSEESSPPSTGETSEDPLVPTGGDKTEPQTSGGEEEPKAEPNASTDNTNTTTTDPGGFEDNQKEPPAQTGESASSSSSSSSSGGEGTDKPAEGPVTKDGNETTPLSRGTIPGVAPLRAPASTEETTEHPAGNAVTVAKPGDPAFADDAKLAERYKGTANVFNSHGMPGTIVGGVPREKMEQFMKDDKPLIVASCFSAAPTAGGSTIRRMASTYSDDPAVASRVYGCSGYAYGSDAGGLSCSGAWLDGNGRAVPTAERERLGLTHGRCNVNTLDSKGQPIERDCGNPSAP